METPRYTIITLVLLIALTGCSKIGLDKVVQDKRTTYQKSKSLPELEIPPDLTSDTINDSMEIPGEEKSSTFSEYQQQKNITLQKQNDSLPPQDEYTVEIAGSASSIWTNIEQFLKTEGYSPDLADTELGVMETNWKTEDNSRHKIKLFLEPSGSPNQSLLIVSAEKQRKQDGDWQPNDPETTKKQITRKITEYFNEPNQKSSIAEKENLEETLVIAEPKNTELVEDSEVTEKPEYTDTETAADTDFITSVQQPAETIVLEETKEKTTKKLGSSAKIVQFTRNKSFLNLPQEYTQSWKNVREILKQAGYSIEKSEPSLGLYHIVYQRNNRKIPYIISLIDVGENTELVVLANKNKWDTNKDSKDILETVMKIYNAQY